MDRLLQKLYDYCALDKSQTMRERLFRLMCLVIVFVCLCVVIPTNLFEPDMPVLVNVLDVGFGLFALFCFTETRRGRYHVKVLVTAIGLALSLAWFFDGGMDGSLNFYFFGLVVLPMVFFEGRLRWIFVAAILVDFSGLNLIGYHFPKLVTAFPSRREEVIDVVSGSVAAYTTIVMLIWMVVKHYDNERDRLSQSARELAVSEEKFSQAFRSSPNGIALTEMDTGRFIEVNDCFCRIYGYSVAEVTGRTALELGLWTDAAERDRLLRPLFADGVVRDLELPRQLRDGRTKIVLFNAELVELVLCSRIQWT